MTIPARRKASRRDPRVRATIALRAAQLMYHREETEYFTAKRKAARHLGIDWKHSPQDLPSNAEIRERIHTLASMVEGEQRGDDLRQMRLLALRHLRLLEPFRPRLIGSTLTGHTRKGSDIDLHVFTDRLSAITDLLDDHALPYRVEHKPVRKHNHTTVYTHIHIDDRFPVELTVYTEAQHRTVFRSSITGKPIERANRKAFEKQMGEWYPDIDLDTEISTDDGAACDDTHRLSVYRLLLGPLEHVKQDPRWHPEGDALYHSLQVFELARASRGWDVEFCEAALLHDVGKAIQRDDHVAAGVDALMGVASERVVTLVAYHMTAHAYRDGSLGARTRRRLEALDDFEDLLELSTLDQAGRRRGAQVCTVEQALHWLAEQGA
ncbi:MAG: HD domain-containing protein [Phycisphaerales bacterium JB063]